ncbi:MAG TPA: PIN domain-containing protein [Thermodesulfobacteriaceae bacterium]|nr:PIN domain-containing protein [Thermodesulfobacteriaceae bacterium]
MNVLIDTSAWIVFFRDTVGTAGDLVVDLIRLDQAYLTGPVMAELLCGARGKQEVKELDTVFGTIPILDVIREDWIKTGTILQDVRKKGVSIPLTDVLIAAVALRNNMAVLTLDKHFQHLPVECVKIQEGK